MTKKPQVTIKMMKAQNPLMADAADIVIELEPEAAPNTVKNFIYLVETGYYNELVFHRIIPGFMIQGGCPHGTGTGGPEYGLDVYKRQIRAGVDSGDPAAGQVAFQMVDEVGPLHRQQGQLGVGGQAGNLLIGQSGAEGDACLLYTSRCV